MTIPGTTDVVVSAILQQGHWKIYIVMMAIPNYMPSYN